MSFAPPITVGSFPSSPPMPRRYGVSMEQSSQTREQLSQVARQMSDARADRVVAFLGKLHPVKTCENVAAETGIRAATVRQWVARESAPNFRALFRLMCAYGPDLLCAALDNPPRWLSEAARAEEQARIDAEIAALQARRARL